MGSEPRPLLFVYRSDFETKHGHHLTKDGRDNEAGLGYWHEPDPNGLFMQCCQQRGLPDACLRHCTYNTFTKESLTRMYFKHDACPVQASAEIQFCAAQGRDHRECCQRNGVATTLAGLKCLTFCDQRPGNVTMLDMSYVPCYDRFENMKACFWHDTVYRLK
ncbi:DB module [Dictyocaulus viviparus]|uniref:DB module n=1 Tax=Dictyocaulus viviparus TaxID=29172 RepID=A0A0D8XKR9_DICVI|nr:DB module [Dictyocaulus viviparus]